MRLPILLLLPFAAVSAQDKPDFATAVAPILIKHCVECHGPKKHEGHLQLDRKAHLFHAKEDKWVVRPGKADDSELLRRVQLPAGDEDVMPAEGDHLTAAEIAALKGWIDGGADWPETADALFVAAESSAVPAKSDFALPLDEANKQALAQALAALTSKGVLAQRVAADTEAVDVNLSLSGPKVDDAQVGALAPLAPALVWLNLARTKVSDAGLAVVAGMSQLRRLNLANTAITDAGLGHLAGLSHLEVLNLYGTKVTDAGLQQLHGLKKLRKLYLWQTAVTAAGAEALQQKLTQLQIDRGEYVEVRLQAAAAEIAAQKERNTPVNTTCPVSGKPIDANAWIDHDGLRIAFCCQNCLAEFKKDPSKFAAKIAEYKAAKAAPKPDESKKDETKPAEPKKGG
jgi:mono/diheme cytochrome c family protein/YHS domain-containing protein